MSTPILATKLYIPSTRPELVYRPRLIERLNEGLHRKLTLISAPAGFGKTSVLSGWIPKSPRCVTWLSLDKEDNDSTRFWTYFISSLQGLRSDLGKDALSLLRSMQAPSITSILSTLINEIAAFPDIFAIVLDDYHLIESKPIDQAITFLLEHLPPNMHLVIATREDPNLPLSRLRVQGHLSELRAADLRFTPEEATRFLNETMGLDLSDEEVSSLETRTEGWIAGLKLAALSMQGRDDIPGFIRTFAGDHRYIVDYLVDEVLQHHPEPVQVFLTQTSILNQFCDSLCESVTGQENAHGLLDTLERANLFLIPLDDKRQWFRYHHLFGDVLRAHLMETQPQQIPILHQRAGKWYEQNGFLSDAIRHALAARDFEWAADMVELAWPAMDRSRQSVRWLEWVKAIPGKLLRTRPVLCIGYAWALLDSGKLEAGEARLQDAERWLDTIQEESHHSATITKAMVFVDQEEFQFLPATAASARAYHSLATGDVTGAIKQSQRALSLLPEGEYLRRGTPEALLAIATWTSGYLQAAEQSLDDAMTNYRLAGNILFAITGAYSLAQIRLTLGRLHKAYNTYQQSLQLAEGQDKSVLWGTADVYTGLSEIFCEWNDFDTAEEYLMKSKELGIQAGLPRWHFRWCLAQAQLKRSQGSWDCALTMLDEAERWFVRGPVPDVRSIAAIKTRIWITQNKINEALDWVRVQCLSPEDELSYLHEFDHITLARVMIKQYRNDGPDRLAKDAIRFLGRLLKEAERGGRNGSVIEILALQSLTYEALGDIPSALASLECALTLTEPEGYVRLFVDEGKPMARLLAEAVAHKILPDYSGRLLAKLNEDICQREDQASLPSTQSLIEPLSPREMEVLRLVDQGLSNREISERLFLALSTVKGYNRTIYGKLQVSRRTEALVRARELGLV